VEDRKDKVNVGETAKIFRRRSHDHRSTRTANDRAVGEANADVGKTCRGV
jgi:hypothetical protein